MTNELPKGTNNTGFLSGPAGEYDPSRRVVLIDLSAIFRMVYHATEKEPVSHAESLTLQHVGRIAGSGSGDIVVICCDGKGNWRKELDPKYKAHRDKQPNELYGALERVKDRLRKDGRLLWQFDGFEADDVIYFAAGFAQDAGHDVLIATHDKDLFQCLQWPKVRIQRTDTGETWDEKKLIDNEKIGVSATEFGDWLALVGDKSDGVAGCPGVANVTATALIKEYKTLGGIFEAVAKITAPALDAFWKSRLAKHASLKENETAVKAGRELIGFRRPPFDFAEIYAERKVEALSGNNEEQEYLDKAFGEQGRAVSSVVGENPNGPPKVESKPEQQADARSAPPEAAPATQVSTGDDSPPEMTADVIPPVHELQHEKMTTPPVEKPPLSTALVTRSASEIAMSEFDKDLQPTGMNGLYWLCRRFTDGRMYKKFDSPEQMLTIILRGKAMGMPVAVALDCFHMVEGQPTLKCHVINALAEKEPMFEYLRCVSSTNDGAKWIGKRKDGPEFEHEFTLEDAINHGYCKAEIVPRDPKQDKDRRGMWDKARKEMLRKTAMVQLIRILWPGAAMGLYSYEELGGND